MDFRSFESRILELMFKTDARMIPQYVAYRLECPVEVARQHCEEMVRQGVLTMEVDDKGVIYYDMPGRPPATNEAILPAGANRPQLAPQHAQYAAPPTYAAQPLQQMHVAQPYAQMPVQVQINNVAPPPTMYVAASSTKSAGLAACLALLLGPIGMLYSTVSGALIMFLLNIVIIPATAGAGLLLTLPLGAVWASHAVSEHNRKLVPAGYR